LILHCLRKISIVTPIRHNSMDHLLPDLPTVVHTGNHHLRPYLSHFERDTFLHTDPQILYDRAQVEARAHHLVTEDSDFVVHVPLNQTEHELVLEYLVAASFFDLSLPMHALPLPLTEVYTSPSGFSELPMHRDAVSIMECIGDLVHRCSSMRDTNDEVLRVTKKERDFPVILKDCGGDGVDVRACFRLICQNLDSNKIACVECLFKTLAIGFVEGGSPIVFSLAQTAKKCHLAVEEYRPRFLVNEDSFFQSPRKPIYACDRRRFLCLVEQTALSFFDLFHPIDFTSDNDGEVAFKIPSFRSVTFPTDEEHFVAITACPYDESVLVAAVVGSGVHIWQYQPESETIQSVQIMPDLQPHRLLWIEGCRLVVIKPNGNLEVVANPCEEVRKPPVLIEPTGEFEEIRSRGDAIILQSKETRKLMVIRLDSLAVYEINFTEEVGCGAFARNTLVIATASARNTRVIIWDIRHLRTPWEMNPRKKVSLIQPITMFEVGPPVFLMETVTDFRYIDGHGRTSGLVGLTHDYYDPSGYFMFRLTERGTLDVSWLAPRERAHKAS
jgi:hypothetical protein